MKRKRIIKPFEVRYYTWGWTGYRWIDAPASRGFIGYGRDYKHALEEAYASACRHLGRGSQYVKAALFDRDTDRLMAIFTRTGDGIKIQEF